MIDNKIFENIATERLKEVEFWKRKYHELKMNEDKCTVDVGVVNQLLQILSTNFCIKLKEGKSDEEFNAMVGQIEQLVALNNIDHDLLNAIREARLNAEISRYSNRYTLSSFSRQLSTLRSEIELLHDAQLQNKAVSTLLEQLNDLKRKHNQQIRDHLDFSRETKSHRTHADANPLFEVHMRQLNVFSNLLYEENDRYQAFIRGLIANGSFSAGTSLLARLGELEKTFFDVVALRNVSNEAYNEALNQLNTELDDARLKNKVG